MADEPTVDLERDWEFLLAFLPAGWEQKAKELGAVRRCRKVPDARVLLRVLLIHLAEGCSLREAAVRARGGGIVDLSDVRIKNRMECAGEWFRWMSTALMFEWGHAATAGRLRQPVECAGDGWHPGQRARPEGILVAHPLLDRPAFVALRGSACDWQRGGRQW